MADEENEAPAKSGGLVKMLIFGVVGLIVIVGSQLGTLILARTMMPDLIFPEWMMAMAPPPPEVEEEVEPLPPPVYTRMDPSIVVSYQNGQSVRFLQVTLEAMARDQESIDNFTLHSPRIRNDLLMLFASETLDSLATIEAKEIVRQAALDKINSILQEESPESEIEDVFFTSFVVQ